MKCVYDSIFLSFLVLSLSHSMYAHLIFSVNASFHISNLHLEFANIQYSWYFKLNSGHHVWSWSWRNFMDYLKLISFFFHLAFSLHSRRLKAVHCLSSVCGTKANALDWTMNYVCDFSKNVSMQKRNIEIYNKAEQRTIGSNRNRWPIPIDWITYWITEWSAVLLIQNATQMARYYKHLTLCMHRIHNRFAASWCFSYTLQKHIIRATISITQHLDCGRFDPRKCCKIAI